ncbi:MAG: anhydro-N-acetylmuramic acid kinase [Planctomycetes bacterium]|nr:anhydro-N-acetylmuramic acid kinase [Planctomycetota bacterium]
MSELAARVRAGEALVAGVLSGTSADAIDVGVARFESERVVNASVAASSVSVPRAFDARSAAHERLARTELVTFATFPFEPRLARELRAVLDGEPCDLRRAALLDRDLGRAFGRAVRALAERERLAIELVGSHGQTVYHHDGVEASGPATLQLGDACFVAEEARATTVGDFRQRDVARGGEGAPISALADDLIFHAAPKPCAILNLGGMANLTILGDDAPPLAFDTGPANALLDGLARRLLGTEFDRDGASARRGRVHAALVDELLAHEFLRRAPPKSTGRDTFGVAWVDGVIVRARALGIESTDDVLASAVDFVARSVADGLARFVPVRPDWLVLAGGGVRNAALVDALALRCPQPVASAEDFGVDPKAREALVFAVLAARHVCGEATTEPRATGARRGSVLGKLSPWSGA